MARKFREMANNRDIYYYAHRRVVNFERAYQPLHHGTKVLVMPQFSYMPDQILGKMKKGQNLTFLQGPSLPKYKDVFKIFLTWPKVFGYRLGIVKISLKNLNSFLSYLEKT